MRKLKATLPAIAGVLTVVLTSLAAAPAASASAASASAASASAAGGTGPSRGGVTGAWNYGVDAAEQVNMLPVLEPTATAGGQSSFDRDTFDQTHGNYDFGHFLSTSKKFGNVMLDQKGPGCVYRIWMTSLQSFFPNEWIKIYLDGAARPAINMTIGQIFAGTHAPFLAPLVQGPAGSSGGYVSYVPFCYHRSIQIVTSMDRYYDIGYVTYAPNANVKTWSPSQDTTALRQLWTGVTQDPVSTTGNQTATGTMSLPAHKTAPILNLTGPESIQSIKLTIPGVTATQSLAAAAVLNQTWIQIYWDGQKIPSVSAPIGSFFGMGQFGSYPTHGLVVGMDAANELYMYLPMPFQHSALIQLWNRGSTAVAGVGYDVQYQPYTGSFASIGYFKTSFTTTNRAKPGNDIPILNTKGSGKFIGVTASYTGDPAQVYLEGDERIYVDGSSSPSIYGTGTEDFFNGAFYFIDGPYSDPMSGNTAHLSSKSVDEIAAYRFFLPDAIPFRSSIVVGIQHGPYDNTNRTSASMLAYYYQKPSSQEVLTDSFDVGKTPSDRAHHYVIADQSFSGRNVYTYEGVAQGKKVADDGRGDRGYSRFTMRIAANNQGVDLRRRFDQGVPNQQAKVYVNGKLVGTWLTEGSNPYHRWAESDFIIPARYTRSKGSVTLKIQYVSGSPYWTEYRYWAYSLVP